jgi:hypothetical protein
MLVTAVLLLALKRAFCWKLGEALVTAGDLPCGSPAMQAGASVVCRVKLPQRLACAGDSGPAKLLF